MAFDESWLTKSILTMCASKLNLDRSSLSDSVSACGTGNNARDSCFRANAKKRVLVILVTWGVANAYAHAPGESGGEQAVVLRQAHTTSLHESKPLARTSF